MALAKSIPCRYFLVKEDKSPFSVTVTPCDAALEWRLTIQDWPTHSAHRSGRSQELEWDSDTPRDLFTYKGNAVKSYVRISSHSAFYMLQLMSIESNTQIRVYMTTNPQSEPPDPEIPFDPRVDVTSVGQTTVTLAWNASPSILRYQEHIQYCLLINQKQNYKSLCAAKTQVERLDDHRPDVPVVSIYSGGRVVHLTGMEDLLLPSRVLSSSFSKEPKLDVMQLCVGNRNVYSMSELQPNTRYYFDVFAVNVLTNTSSAYTGTFAKTLQWPDPKILDLKEGIMIQVYVRKGGQKFYSFRPDTWHRRAQFTFYSCGKVYVQIERNGKLALSGKVENLKHFQLKGKAKTRYVIGIKSTESSETPVKILASTRPNKALFPRLPASLKLKTFDKLRTCNSVTVAWLGTQEQNKYCLYKREIREQVEKEIKRLNRCFGPERWKISEKVRCKYFHNLNSQRAVTVEKVSGLKAGTPYLFDVYVFGYRGHSVKYQSKVIKTRKAC
ncbi:protein NDNF-like [Carcharodon carcharias]|uniref:protein NDNF-like n=1 Tax=Carcharodon carcharias TaxID=13397 RepID=UPI001B7EEEFE|nr:protein NDNF-like [Carcharodon carcharias]